MHILKTLNGSKKLSILSLLALLLLTFTLQQLSVFAGAGESARGFAWGGTSSADGAYQGIGWISMNNISDGSGTSYGVNIPATDGPVTGYGWSEHYGWISFNGVHLAGCAPALASPSRVGNTLTGGARVLAIQSAIASSNAGGYDGCIDLSGISIAGNALSGYAWSSDLGWIDFSGVTLAFLPQCSDGIDNADPEDVLVDMADPGCTDPTDTDETDGGAPQCSDGIDNADPEDTLIDMADPGCADVNDDDETDGGGLPDLTVVNTTPLAGADLDNPGNVTFAGIITNVNVPTLPGENVWADVEIDWNQANCATAASETVANAGGPWTNMGIGATQNANVTLTAASSELRNGDHCYRMIVDRGNLVTESDNTNNAGPWFTFSISNLPQCSDGVDNADPEDTLMDSSDPGCLDAGGVYDPTDTDETDGGGSAVTCSPSTINNCVLPSGNLGETVNGSCSLGYSGSCNFTCIDGGSGSGNWDENSNSCALTPVINSFVVCDADGVSNCTSGTKDVPPTPGGVPLILKWTSSNTDRCEAFANPGDFEIPDTNGNSLGDPSGQDGITSAPLGGVTKTYTIACSEGGVNPVFKTVKVRTTGPTISIDKRIVDIGEIVRVSWKPTGGICNITGGGINIVGATTDDFRDVVVNAQTKFTLTCDIGSDDVTVTVTGWTDDT